METNQSISVSSSLLSEGIIYSFRWNVGWVILRRYINSILEGQSRLHVLIFGLVVQSNSCSVLFSGYVKTCHSYKVVAVDSVSVMLACKVAQCEEMIWTFSSLEKLFELHSFWWKEGAITWIWIFIMDYNSSKVLELQRLLSVCHVDTMQNNEVDWL